MSDNPDERCYHGNTPLEGCTLCAEEKAPSSETERLLAGSLAIAELAALRRKIQGMHKYFVDRSNEFFDKSAECEGADDGRWSARGTAWYEAANKLKELLGDAQ